MTGVHGMQAVILLLLVFVAVFAVLADRLRVPYPVLLVIAGLLASFIPHVPQVQLSPDLVFLVFLPPLLFAAAWQTSWREFRHHLVPVLMLALGLVGVTVVVVALFSDRFITALDFRSGFLLGAVVATTDAIAATSMASRVGLPARVVEILEGESLLNDATGLLALEFGVRMLETGSTPTLGQGSLRLLWLAGAGIAAGLAVGLIVWWVERWIDDGPVEMVISIVAPYAAYLAAEEIHASGVLAVVACGLYLGRQSTEIFSPKVRMQVQHGWESLNFALNGLVFLLVGLQLPYVLRGIHGYSVRMLIEYGAVFSIVLIVLRLLWTFPAMWAAHGFRRLLRQNQPMLPPKESFVIGWTGMRGVIALAAAFSLPETLGNGEPFQQRDLIVFLTFVVILVTLVAQGLSLPTVMRVLRLDNKDHHDEEETQARRKVLEEAIQFLEQEQSQHNGDFNRGFQHLLERYHDRMEALDDHEAGPERHRRATPRFYRRFNEMTQRALEVERSAAVRLRDEGTIGDAVLNRIQNELDLTETRLKLHR